VSAASSSVDDPLSEVALRRVNDLCVRFEHAWREGQRPSLEAFLAGAQGPERAELLRELLRLDVRYRQGRGERPAADDYEGRFPGDGALIRAVLAEGGPSSRTPPRPDPTATPRARVPRPRP
jgi:hypothetical protein